MEKVDRTLGVLIAFFIVVFLLTFRGPLQSDEKAHYPQIISFINGSAAVNPDITTIPGYHVVMAGIGKLFGITSVPGLRFVTFLFALLSLGVFSLLLKELNQDHDKVLLFALMPITFPFFFLLFHFF